MPDLIGHLSMTTEKQKRHLTWAEMLYHTKILIFKEMSHSETASRFLNYSFVDFFDWQICQSKYCCLSLGHV